MTSHRKTQPSITAGQVSLPDGSGFPPIHMSLPYRPKSGDVFLYQIRQDGYELVRVKSIEDGRRRFAKSQLPFTRPDARDVRDGIVLYRRGWVAELDIWETVPLDGEYPIDASVGNERTRS